MGFQSMQDSFLCLFLPSHSLSDALEQRGTECVLSVEVLACCLVVPHVLFWFPALYAMRVVPSSRDNKKENALTLFSFTPHRYHSGYCHHAVWKAAAVCPSPAPQLSCDLAGTGFRGQVGSLLWTCGLILSLSKGKNGKKNKNKKKTKRNLFSDGNFSWVLAHFVQ